MNYYCISKLYMKDWADRMANDWIRVATGEIKELPEYDDKIIETIIYKYNVLKTENNYQIEFVVNDFEIFDVIKKDVETILKLRPEGNYIIEITYNKYDNDFIGKSIRSLE